MISVIIPVYNVEQYLFTCINSVLRQTYSDFEIICIDDASSDSSLDILNYFSRKDSRIKVIKNETNMGPGFSRNRGIKIAKGKYISFLDSDDFLSPNAFEILIEKMEKDNLDVLMFKNVVFYQDNKNFGMESYYDMKFMDKFENQVFNHMGLDKTKLFVIPNSPWNKFYLTSFLEDNNICFPNENLIHEDNPFFYEVITSAERISIINSYLYNRRRRSGSIMTLTNERIFDNIKISQMLLDYFMKKPELYDYYKKEILTYIFNIFNSKYYQIDDELKEEFYLKVQKECKVFIGQYGIYEDINENIDSKILEFFRFENLVSEVSSPTPKISVIVPVYNVEKYLERAFNSLLNQTIGFENLEVIFIDDASTDNSANMIKGYSDKFENVKSIFLDKNSGSAGKPRNIGMRHAVADYIMFLDSDDTFMDDACEVLFNEITNDNVDVVSGATSWDGVNPSTGLWLSILTDPNDNFQDRTDKVNYLLKNEFPFKIDALDDYASIIGDFAFIPKIYKKSFLEQHSITFAEEIIAEDSVFMCNVFLNANGIKYINKIVYFYYHERMDGIDKSMSYIHSKKVLMGLIDAFFMMYGLCLEKNKQDIFKHYLLFPKLEYFLHSRLLKSDLPMDDVLDLLIHATPLFQLYCEYNENINSNLKNLYEFIANEDYENAIIFIFGDEISNKDNFKSLFNKNNAL